MGEISDVISAIADIAKTTSNAASDSIDAVSTVMKAKSGSLSSMALQGVANFPMLVSDGINDLDDALMIAGAAEQRFATFLLTVLTMNPYLAVDKNEIPSAAEYLKKYHQNMGVQHEMNQDLTKIVLMQESTEVDVREDLVSFVEESLGVGAEYGCWITESLQIVSAIYEGIKDHGIDLENSKLNYSIEDVTEQVTLNSLGRSASLMESSVGSESRNKPSSIKYLENNDFKRANESVPTLLHIRVYPYRKDTGAQLDPLDFVVGVKATLHQIPSHEMVANLANGLRNDNTFFNFVRWTTGETKFFKDFLLAIDQQKMDAKNTGSGVSGWWSALRRRKASSTIRKFAKGKRLLPNTSIVCTTDDLLTLRDEYGFDLTTSNPTLMVELMKKYFLLSFIRVDPALQRVDFLYDGNTQYETYSYSTLSKDVGKDGKKFKDMMRMLGRSS